jgi:catechol 2,3-dioxygenase
MRRLQWPYGAIRPIGFGFTIGGATKAGSPPVASRTIRRHFDFSGNLLSCGMANPAVIHPDVRIGHVHLKVAELERALHFYRDVLGFQITQRYGKQSVFLSAGGYHHHIGLNTWESAGGASPPAGTTGLYHVAILYPTRALLADALRRVMAANLEL